jgi:hypothetical protein
MVLNLKNLDDWGIGSASDYCKLWINNGVDISGNGKTVTLNGTPTPYKLKNGETIHAFDADTKYYSLSSSTDFNLGTGDFAMGGWFRLTNTSNYPTTWCWISNNAFNYCYISATTILLRLNNNDSTHTISFATNMWYHIYYSRTGTSLKLYINGVLVNTFTNGGNIPQDGIRIGAYLNNLYPVLGQINNFAIFKGIALTAGQIKALYDATYIE